MPFRFENMWLKVVRFKDLVKVWWDNVEVSGLRSYILMEKIKAIKASLRRWNRDVFGKWEVRKKVALKKVAHWDSVETQTILTLREIEDKLATLEEFKHWATLEEIS